MTSAPTSGGAQGGGAGVTPFRLLAAAVGIALVPYAVAIARAAVSGWEPTGDQAMEVLRMYDFGTSETPLVGPYSRFGWNHPGPLLFWLGGPPLRIAGPAGVMVVVALVNGAAFVAAVAAARRLAGDGFALAVAALSAVMVHNHGAAKLVDPWNPWVTLLPLLCYLLCVALAAIRGGRWPTLVAVATGSYVAQSHLGNVPVVGAVAAAGIGWWLWRARGAELGRQARSADAEAALADESVGSPAAVADTTETADGARRTRNRPPATLLMAVGLGLLLWSGPLVDQVTEQPGNLEAVVRFALDSPESPGPIDFSLGVAARELGPTPPWAGAEEGVWPVEPAPTWTLAVVPVLLLAGMVTATRRRAATATVHVPLAGLALVAYAASVLAVTRTTGGLIPHVLRWTWPVAVFSVVVALLPLVEPIGTRTSGRGASLRVVAAAMAAVVVLGAAGATTRDTVRRPILPSPHTDSSAAGIVAGAREVLPKGTYGLMWLDVRSFSAISIGVGAGLTRHGYEIDFPTNHADRVGEFRATGRTDVPLVIVVGQTPLETWQPPEGARRVLRWDHLTDAERARADDLEDRVRSDASMERHTLVAVDTESARGELVAAGARRADVEELGRLQADREPYEIWLAPAGTPR